MEANLEMQNDEDSSDSDNMPIFTSELAKLKEKELGMKQDNDEEGVDPDEDIGMDGDHDADYKSHYSESSEEKDDYMIRNTDSLIVTATADDDHSNLEVYVYDHKNGDLYVHHEIILSSYPLCLEWLRIWNQQ
jgi:periodic tryptophan protein 1